MIKYRVGHEFTVEQAREVYAACSLGPRRPIDDAARFVAMLKNANLIVTAWDGDLMVGIARCLSDWSYVTYVSDLAVCESHQHCGIGRELLRQVRKQAPQTSLVLFAAPQAQEYYGRIGFTQHPSGWMLKPGEPL